MTKQHHTIPSPLMRYQRLIDISRDLASTLDLDTLLQRIVNASADLTNSEAASILLFDQNKDLLFFQASTNLQRPLMGGLSVPVDGSIAGWVAQHRQPVIVTDPQNDPRFYGHIQKEADFSTQSILAVPMITKNDVIGVLEALNKNDGEFNLEDQEMLMTLGAQAAVAITNARLFIQADLISEMVHELRTPLASLNAATHLLLRPDIDKDQHNKMVMIIQNETNRLSEMATSFLDLARLESGRTQFQVTEIEMVLLLGECVGITRSTMDERNIKLEWKVPDRLPKIKGDADKIKQVFLNLLSNAVKYNTEGGKLTVAAYFVDQNMVIDVSDTGPGIPEESMEHLFQKFYRVPGTENLAQGTGLGLSIVNKIVTAHGGKITVKSEVGKGTTFSVHLPIDGEKTGT
jgi:signal transduction histidine kinase